MLPTIDLRASYRTQAGSLSHHHHYSFDSMSQSFVTALLPIIRARRFFAEHHRRAVTEEMDWRRHGHTLERSTSKTLDQGESTTIDNPYMSRRKLIFCPGWRLTRRHSHALRYPKAPDMARDTSTASECGERSMLRSPSPQIDCQ